MNQNGYITFESGLNSSRISLPSVPIPVLAPFAADIDTTISDPGMISYQHIVSGGIDESLLETVSYFIRTNQRIRFDGNHMFVTYYEEVVQHSGSPSEVNLLKLKVCNITKCLVVPHHAMFFYFLSLSGERALWSPE